jgi:hypothetical protein
MAMKISRGTLGVITALSLATISFLCYEQPDPPPSPGEVNVIVGAVIAAVLSLKWMWLRARGPVVSH